jgi:hypothetical protein
MVVRSNNILCVLAFVATEQCQETHQQNSCHAECFWAARFSGHFVSIGSSPITARVAEAFNDGPARESDGLVRHATRFRPHRRPNASAVGACTHDRPIPTRGRRGASTPFRWGTSTVTTRHCSRPAAQPRCWRRGARTAAGQFLELAPPSHSVQRAWRT